MGFLLFIILMAILIRQLTKIVPATVRFGQEHPTAVRTGLHLLKRLLQRR